MYYRGYITLSFNSMCIYTSKSTLDCSQEIREKLAITRRMFDFNQCMYNLCICVIMLIKSLIGITDKAILLTEPYFKLSLTYEMTKDANIILLF